MLHILPSLDIGGLGTLALNLIRAWPVEDRHVVIAPFTPTSKPELKPEFEHLKCVVVEVVRNPLQPMEMVEQVQYSASVKVGLLPDEKCLIYNISDCVWHSMALRRAGAKPENIFCHAGTVPPDEKAETVYKIMNSPFTEGVRFIFASAAVRDRLVQIGIPKAAAGPVIWNGVESKRFSFSREHKDPFITSIGFVGRMAPEAKDYPTLIRAFGRMRSGARSALFLAGDGPSRGEYQRLVREEEIQGVTFLGALRETEIPLFLEYLDIFVMASLPIEGMSIALVEAICAGLPIIATDAPSNIEVLGGSGCIVPSGDPDIMAKALYDMVLSSRFRYELGQACEKRRHEFSIQTCAKKYYEFFQTSSGRISPS